MRNITMFDEQFERRRGWSDYIVENQPSKTVTMTAKELLEFVKTLGSNHVYSVGITTDMWWETSYVLKFDEDKAKLAILQRMTGVKNLDEYFK